MGEVAKIKTNPEVFTYLPQHQGHIKGNETDTYRHIRVTLREKKVKTEPEGCTYLSPHT